MKTRTQIILALVLILIATGVVALNARSGGSQQGADQDIDLVNSTT